MSNTEPTNYIGLTIGPIYKTLTALKSTRALFSGSYIFSFIMGEILQSLLDQGVPAERVLLPSTELLKTKQAEAGIFPDRMIMEAREDDFKKLEIAREQTLTTLTSAISTDLGKDKDQLLKYLKDYFQIYFFEAPLEQNENTIRNIHSYLNTLELQQNFPKKDTDDLFEFLNRKKSSFIIKDAFPPAHRNRFPSLIQIASRELKSYAPEEYNKIIQEHIYNKTTDDSIDVEDDEDVIKALKRHDILGKKFKAYHKYIAIVHADGDNMGEYLKRQNVEKSKLNAFSKKLMDFRQTAKNTIKRYGGQPVYIGGDDLVFFAPLASRIDDTYQTLFDLIQQLDLDFHKDFDRQPGDPTLSYGVSITYYKYPVNEAFQLSRNMLDEVAKNKQLFPKKNALAFQLTKHSGHTFQASFDKGGTAYQDFLKALQENIQDEQKFINSITHTLDFHRNTINHIFNKLPDSEKRIKFLFDNNFDEFIHKQNKGFMNSMVDLLIKFYKEYPIAYTQNEKKGNQPLDKLYSVLRLTHLFKGNDI